MADVYEPKILVGGELKDDDAIIDAHAHRVRRVSGPALSDAEGAASLIITSMLQRLRVRDVMRDHDIYSVTRSDSMQFAQNLMKRNKISGVPVVEGKRLFGIVSVNDIIDALEAGWMRDTCQQHMSTNLVVLETDMPLVFATKCFENYTFRRFPVLDKDRNFVGIVAQRDVMRVLMRELSGAVASLEVGSSASPTAQSTEKTLPNYSMRQFEVVHNDLSNAGKAANAMKKILKDAGVDNKVARRIAVAAYELEINICIHSVGGTITLILDTEKATVIAKDHGPGIENVEWACRDGTSTANDWIRSMGFGAGMGLSNSKRVSDNFNIQSKVPTGTTVVCEFNIGKPRAPASAFEH